MAHYAFLDSDNIVTEVITGIDETKLIDGLTPEEWYGNFRGQTCVRTSYNGKIRGTFAGIGYEYRSDIDAFVAPQPFASWTLDENAQWKSPVPYPVDSKMYEWNEEKLTWDLAIAK